MHRFYERVFGVYFDDLDPFEILHNARYLFLFERALGAFWMEIGWGSFQGDAQQFHLVARNEVDYLSAVRGVSKVRVRVWAEKIGRSSLTFAFRMLPLDRDEDHARGRRTIVHVDRNTLEPLAWSDTFRETLDPWLERPE